MRDCSSPTQRAPVAHRAGGMYVCTHPRAESGLQHEPSPPCFSISRVRRYGYDAAVRVAEIARRNDTYIRYAARLASLPPSSRREKAVVTVWR